MSIQKELEDLIKNEVLIEIEDYIDELFEISAAKKDDDAIKEELKQVQEMKKDFEDMLVDLANGEIDDEEAQEIIEEINDMRKEEDEDEE
jgi:allophanate hydrolase subunit 1